MCLHSADVSTDALILYELINSGQQWWSAFMLLAIIAPYVVSYSALGALLEVKVRRFQTFENKLKKQESLCHCCKMVYFYSLLILTCTPLCLFYFLLLDVTFAIYSVVTTFLFLLTFGKINIANIAEDYFFTKLLGMTRMELIGYRRLRTISQILFESIPEIFIQLRILAVMNENNSNNSGDDAENYGVTNENLYFSILFAGLHMFFEGLMIYLIVNQVNALFILMLLFV